jgi:RHS repeat-associated protein
VASGVQPTIGFTGHVNDVDTGLTYMQQRYYDPVAGRFLSIDPISTDITTGQNFNRYAYSINNPYTYIDPDGREEEKNDQKADKRDEQLRNDLARARISLCAGMCGGAFYPEQSSGPGPSALAVPYLRMMGEAAGEVYEKWAGVSILAIAHTSVAEAPITLSTAEVKALIVGNAVQFNKQAFNVASESQLLSLFQKITIGAKSYLWKGYDGFAKVLGDGTQIGLRRSSTTGGKTIDVRPPNGKSYKVHIDGK